SVPSWTAPPVKRCSSTITTKSPRCRLGCILPLSTTTAGGQSPVIAKRRRPITATTARLESTSRPNTTHSLSVFLTRFIHARKPLSLSVRLSTVSVSSSVSESVSRSSHCHDPVVSSSESIGSNSYHTSIY